MTSLGIIENSAIPSFPEWKLQKFSKNKWIKIKCRDKVYSYRIQLATHGGCLI